MESPPMSTSKSSGRVSDKLDLCAWFLDPHMWTLRFSYLVFTTTCMDVGTTTTGSCFFLHKSAAYFNGI